MVMAHFKLIDKFLACIKIWLLSFESFLEFREDSSSVGHDENERMDFKKWQVSVSIVPAIGTTYPVSGAPQSNHHSTDG